MDGARKRTLSINTQKEKRGTQTVVNGSGLTEAEGLPLSPGARLFHQPHFNCTIVLMMGMGKPIDVDAVKAGLEATIVRHPRFSSTLVSDGPGSKNARWVPTKVVIDNHIVIPNLKPPQNTTNISTSSDQLIEDYVSSLSVTHLPLSRPLWDIHVINMRTAEAEAVAIFRIHHSLGDDISLVSLFLSCMRKTSDPDSAPSLPGAGRKKISDSIIGSRSRVLGLLAWLWAMFVLAWHTLVDVVLFAATSTFLKDTKTPIEAMDGVEFHQKRIVHKTVSLDDIKVVKHAVGSTINDVLVGATSAGLSRYLNRRYSRTADGEKKENNLPENIRLRTNVFVNIRPAPGIPELAEMMEGGKRTRWGNCIGCMTLQLPVVMYEDPLDYVRKGMEIAKRKKKSLAAVFTYGSFSLILKLLGIKAAAALCYRIAHNTTITFSNVVGPVEEIGLYGHPLVYIAISAYGYPQAVTLHFLSYVNKMTMVLAADELTVPDPHQLLDDLAESLKLIKDAVAMRSS